MHRSVTTAEVAPMTVRLDRAPGWRGNPRSTVASIAVNGVTLNVIVEGEGPDVLLVHGFPRL